VNTPTGIPTTERLALALEALDDPRLSDIIKQAREGLYDDFKTTIAVPLVMLVEHLRAIDPIKFSPFIARVMNGEFDATPEEADEWLFSPEGQETLALLRSSDVKKSPKK
jgi:hypothetical protein